MEQEKLKVTKELLRIIIKNAYMSGYADGATKLYESDILNSIIVNLRSEQYADIIIKEQVEGGFCAS